MAMENDIHLEPELCCIQVLNAEPLLDENVVSAGLEIFRAMSTEFDMQMPEERIDISARPDVSNEYLMRSIMSNSLFELPEDTGSNVEKYKTVPFVHSSYENRASHSRNSGFELSMTSSVPTDFDCGFRTSAICGTNPFGLSDVDNINKEVCQNGNISLQQPRVSSFSSIDHFISDGTYWRSKNTEGNPEKSTYLNEPVCEGIEEDVVPTRSNQGGFSRYPATNATNLFSSVQQTGELTKCLDGYSSSVVNVCVPGGQVSNTTESNVSQWHDGRSDHYALRKLQKVRAVQKPPTTAGITLEDLKSVFHLHRPEAEKRLNLKRTTFSNLSRHFGISKWPFRTLRDAEKRMSHNENILKKTGLSQEKKRKILDQQRHLRAVKALMYNEPHQSKDSNTLSALLKLVGDREP